MHHPAISLLCLFLVRPLSAPPLLSVDASCGVEGVIPRGHLGDPLYGDSFYVTVTKAIITAKAVTTDLERTKELIKQFYQTNLGRDWRPRRPEGTRHQGGRRA